MATDSAASRDARRFQLAAILRRHKLEALVLHTPANFAWYTGGADNRVNQADAVGVAALLVTRDDERVIATNIEAQRMRDEQTRDIEVVAYQWHTALAEAVRGITGEGARLGLDVAPDGEWQPAEMVESDTTLFRCVLDAEAIARYWQVGADAMAALEAAVAQLASGVTERAVAGHVAQACARAGLHTPVILVAGDERIAAYRHPIVSEAACARRVMIVLCAERGGLVVNLTRFIHFEEPDAEWRRRQSACEAILRRMRLEATRPGRTLAQAFAACQRYYAEAGYQDEWQNHHQGGLTGYASREVIATPRTDQIIQIGHAFAWNPSVPGAKAEETFVLTENGPVLIAGIVNV